MTVHQVSGTVSAASGSTHAPTPKPTEPEPTTDEPTTDEPTTTEPTGGK